jgi:hypothetical protein
MVTSGGANFSVMTVSPKKKVVPPCISGTGGPCRANRVPREDARGRDCISTNASSRSCGVCGAEGKFNAGHARPVPALSGFIYRAGRVGRPSGQTRTSRTSTKVRMLAINRNPAVNRHRSERAHPRLPWHSQCPLTGIGRGTECSAWLDAPRFAAKPQVQGRLASGEEFGPFCEYAPTAARFKPRRTQTHLTSKIWDVVIESKAAGRLGWPVIRHP